jgi:hypothetical protein
VSWALLNEPIPLTRRSLTPQRDDTVAMMVEGVVGEDLLSYLEREVRSIRSLRFRPRKVSNLG